MTEEKKHHEGHSTHHESHSTHHQAHHTTHAGGSPLQGLPEIPKVDFAAVTPDKMKGGIADVLEILKMNKAKIDAVGGRDGEGITMALIYMAVGLLGAPLGGAIIGYTFLKMTVRTPILSALISWVVAVAIGFIGLYITNLVAERLFKGKGKFGQYFRVMGYASFASVLGFLTFIPIVGSLAVLWVNLVINYLALKQVHKLDNTNAILAMIVSFVITMILAFVVASVGLGAAMGGGMMGGFGGSASY
jgi:hypothetical protein